MSHDHRKAVETLREKVKSGERGGSETERELLLEFSDQLKVKREDYGWARHEKMLRHNVRICENVDVNVNESILEDASDADDEMFYAAKEVAEAAVAWIHENYDPEDGSQETNRDYRVAFRLLARHCTRGDDVPETHEWISTKTTRDYQPEPDEAEMLSLSEEIPALLEGARNERDAAAIAVQFEGGFRGESELYDMTLDQISAGDHSKKIRVDGKRGAHDVHLIWSVPYLNDWLAEHPGESRDSYLWTKKNEDTRISYVTFLNMFKKPAERAGIEKKVTPTNFRKSNAYWLAQREKSQAFIEDRQGRARGSPVISRYVAKFSGQTQEKQYAAMHGIDVGDREEATEDVKPISCPRCGVDNSHLRDFCKQCTFALDHEAQQLIDGVKEVLDEEAMDADDRDRREKVIRSRQRIESNPEILSDDEVHDVLSSVLERSASTS